MNFPHIYINFLFSAVRTIEEVDDHLAALYSQYETTDINYRMYEMSLAYHAMRRKVA